MLKTTIIEAWNSIESNIMCQLMENVKNCLNKIIKCKGEPTKY